jgi:hypothetical protein
MEAGTRLLDRVHHVGLTVLPPAAWTRPGHAFALLPHEAQHESGPVRSRRRVATRPNEDALTVEQPLRSRLMDPCAECPRLSKGDRECLVFRQA